MENLKYLLANGQESMTIRQIADALKEANNLIEENQKLRERVKELEEMQKNYEIPRQGYGFIYSLCRFCNSNLD